MKRAKPKLRKVKPTKPPRPSKRRTSIWLDDELRARLLRRAHDENRSLANIIDTLLREGLQRRAKKVMPDATIFG